MEEKHRNRTSSQQAVHQQIQPPRGLQQSHHFGGRGAVQTSRTRSNKMDHASKGLQGSMDASGDLMFGGFLASFRAI